MPELAVVVLSVGTQRGLSAAVASLREQLPRPEIVVVNSGGGDPFRCLAGIPGVRVIDSPIRWSHGGTRNRGIRATAAPFVAFLSADCTPEPGWVAARLRAHRAGHRAVAGAVVNLDRRSPSAWASYVALFSRRMPGTPPDEVLRYGVSYDRALFDEYGLFAEDLKGGEDTEFHARFGAAVPIHWEPRVRLGHPHPHRIDQLLAEHYRRGRRSASVWRDLAGPGPRQVAADALRRTGADLRRAWRSAEARDRPMLAISAPLVPMSALSYAAGALSIERETRA